MMEKYFNAAFTDYILDGDLPSHSGARLLIRIMYHLRQHSVDYTAFVETHLYVRRAWEALYEEQLEQGIQEAFACTR